MAEKIDPLAGKPAPASALVDVGRLLAAYTERPDPSVPEQRVAFGTSGHRGSSFQRSFNEWHVLAITQAICDFRSAHAIDGPLYIGFDTHALSRPAYDSALEVLGANGVATLVSSGGEFTPTPAVSLAVVDHNRGRDARRADAIVVTPSHNPPDNGGFKYNPPNGGPADTRVTGWIEQRANGYLERGLGGVRRVTVDAALRSGHVHEFDFLAHYVDALDQVLDFAAIRAAAPRLGVDPLGGAGVHYWARIGERYGIDLDVVSTQVDPQFAFMTLDWDGRIRMDPSSVYAMQRLIALRDRYDVAFACDTDHDRHGVVVPGAGLLPANDYQCVLSSELFAARTQWPAHARLGKTIVGTTLLDRVAASLRRATYVVPVGFKWFAAGLLDGSLAFACEESAGASLLRRDGSAWTTDKDGIAAALLAAEVTARRGRNPGELYAQLTGRLGKPFADRVQAPANAMQRRALGALDAGDVRVDALAGEPVTSVVDRAPGNGAPIGGIRIDTEHGWIVARPSGTEDIYKIYAETFLDDTHLRTLLGDAQRIVDATLARAEARAA